MNTRHVDVTTHDSHFDWLAIQIRSQEIVGIAPCILLPRIAVNLDSRFDEALYCMNAHVACMYYILLFIPIGVPTDHALEYASNDSKHNLNYKKFSGEGDTPPHTHPSLGRAIGCQAMPGKYQ
jgi:hypothetical protein